MTGSDGSYVFRFLPEGEWKIVFTPPAGSGLAAEWFDNKPNRTVADPLVIATGDEQHRADAQLAPSG